jgi:hypothetical protein
MAGKKYLEKSAKEWFSGLFAPFPRGVALPRLEEGESVAAAVIPAARAGRPHPAR